ncbi:hypothetical protein ACHAWT_003449 [Skeletonema menzelii]
MSFNARNNRFDPSRRRRRRNHPSYQHSPLATLATTAAVAYGAYRLGSWAWNAYAGKDEEDDYAFGEGSGYDSESESDDGDDFVCSGGESPRRDFRSRRSRGDWSEYNHRRRSHPHSPHHEHNRSSDGATNSAGVGEKIMSSTTAALGAAVSAGISAGINAYNNNQNAAASAQFIRNSRMERCRLEASRAMMDFLPTLKKAIIKETDITAEMEELKSIRVQKKESGGGEQGHDSRARERELWNSIKNKSLTRLLTTIYAHTIVFLVLTVQVNLLGGRLLREEQQEESQEQSSSPSSEESDRYRSSHKTVLAKTYHHVFSKGIPSLVEAVAKAIDDVLQNWDVLGGDDVSPDDVSSWMETVRDSIEKRQQKGNASALVQFIIPDLTEHSSEESMDELARYILDETYDLLESPSYAHAERMCLNITFTHLRLDGYAKLFSSPTINDRGQHEENGSEERKPLAKVITHLQKQTVATFYKPPSHQDEMKDWEGVFRMMEEPLPSAPNVYIPKFFDAVAELSDICFN